MRQSSVREDPLATALTALRPRALGFAYALLRDFHAAEDAVHKAAAIALEKDASRRGEDIDAWYFGILRNVLRGEQRSRQATPLIHDTALVERLAARCRTAPLEPWPLVALRRCFARLSVALQRLFHLRYTERRPCAAIAAELGTGVHTVYTRLKRGKASLRACVERQREDGA